MSCFTKKEVKNPKFSALSSEVKRLKEYGIINFRFDFTIESAQDVTNVLELWSTGNGRHIDYTNGHYKRGVE